MKNKNWYPDTDDEPLLVGNRGNFRHAALQHYYEDLTNDATLQVESSNSNPIDEVEDLNDSLTAKTPSEALVTTENTAAETKPKLIRQTQRDHALTMQLGRELGVQLNDVPSANELAEIIHKGSDTHGVAETMLYEHLRRYLTKVLTDKERITYLLRNVGGSIDMEDLIIESIHYGFKLIPKYFTYREGHPDANFLSFVARYAPERATVTLQKTGNSMTTANSSRQIPQTASRIARAMIATTPLSLDTAPLDSSHTDIGDNPNTEGRNMGTHARRVVQATRLEPDANIFYDDSPNIHEITEMQTEVVRKLRPLFNDLEQREIYSIARRFGLDGKEPATLETVSKELGITRERTRQIERRTIGKMRTSYSKQVFIDAAKRKPQPRRRSPENGEDSDKLVESTLYSTNIYVRLASRTDTLDGDYLVSTEEMEHQFRQLRNQCKIVAELYEPTGLTRILSKIEPRKREKATQRIKSNVTLAREARTEFVRSALEMPPDQTIALAQTMAVLERKFLTPRAKGQLPPTYSRSEIIDMLDQCIAMGEVESSS